MKRNSKRGGIRKSTKARKKRKSNGRRIFWLCLGLILLSTINLIFLDTLLSFRSGWHFLPRFIYTPVVSLFSPKSSKPPKPPDSGRIKESLKPPEEYHKALEQKLKKKPELSKQSIDRPKPCIALVIDDLGYNPELAEDLFEIDLPFTVSILPNLPYSNIIARRANQNDKEVILHLPMEPYDYPNAQVEDGTLLISMRNEEIRQQITMALKGLEGAVGANNHMGSRMVEHEEKMRVVLEEMQKRGLFFLDSRTSPRSVVYDLAKKMGIKTAKRHVFLDGQNDSEYIRKQLDLVVDIALHNGCGIAIGHLQPKTIEVLQSYLPQLIDKDLQFVKLSEVVE